MHKAVGWMLREVGKKDKETLVLFLDEYSTKLPRTALRYSIEHFSPEERAKYMKK
jgi:3-methyladenine DNA glycosylase AlkD